MPKSPTLTVKIIHDEGFMSNFVSTEFTAAQKEFIQLVAKATVQEYIHAQQAIPRENNRDEMLRLTDVTKLTGLSRSTIYAHLKSGRFPEPARLGIRSVRWKRSQVEDWLNKSIAKKQR